MSRITIASLNSRIAALEARLAVATTVYHDQKAPIAKLEAALNTRGVKPAPAAPAAPRRFVQNGQLFERCPIGFNGFAIRPVQVAA